MRKSYSVRLSESERIEFEKRALELNMNFSEYIRFVITMYNIEKKQVSK